MSAKDLDDAIEARRQELRLRWGEVARRSGMVESNLRKIRAGQIALTPFAATGIDQALEWPAGTAMSKHSGPTTGAASENDDGINEEMLAHLHEAWHVFADMDDDDESEAFLTALDRMWRKRERDPHRHRRTMVRFLAEIREVQTGLTDRDVANGSS